MMDHMEQMMLRTTEREPKIPSWAKAENMEACTPQIELWKYADEPTRVKTKKRKRIQEGEVS